MKLIWSYLFDIICKKNKSKIWGDGVFCCFKCYLQNEMHKSGKMLQNINIEMKLYQKINDFCFHFGK